MKCVICDRDEAAGVVGNDRIICHECWNLMHKILGVWSN